MKKIGVIGSGAWGTVIASMLADNGHKVCIYGIDENEIHDLTVNRKNTKYYGIHYIVNAKLNVTSDFDTVKKYNDVFVVAVPSFAISETIDKLKNYITKNTIIINLAKGFIEDSSQTIGEYIRSLLPVEFRDNVVSLLGPTYAVEVAEKQLTAITASSYSYKVSKEVQKIFENNYFKVFPSDDPIGCEYCSSLKNIIALACGISDGLGNKVNTRSAIITEGLKEISKFVSLLGGNEKTCYGLAGVGDLVLTCASSTSRNYSAGFEIGKTSVEEFYKTNAKTVEGVFACKIASTIAKKNGLSVPLIEFIYNIMIDKKDINKELINLNDKLFN